MTPSSLMSFLNTRREGTEVMNNVHNTLLRNSLERAAVPSSVPGHDFLNQIIDKTYEENRNPYFNPDPVGDAMAGNGTYTESNGANNETRESSDKIPDEELQRRIKNNKWRTAIAGATTVAGLIGAPIAAKKWDEKIKKDIKDIEGYKNAAQDTASIRLAAAKAASMYDSHGLTGDLAVQGAHEALHRNILGDFKPSSTKAFIQAVGTLPAGFVAASQLRRMYSNPSEDTTTTDKPEDNKPEVEKNFPVVPQSYSDLWQGGYVSQYVFPPKDMIYPIIQQPQMQQQQPQVQPQQIQRPWQPNWTYGNPENQNTQTQNYSGFLLQKQPYDLTPGFPFVNEYSPLYQLKKGGTLKLIPRK